MSCKTKLPIWTAVVATAIALLWFYRQDWVRIIRGFLRSIGPSIRARRLVIRFA